MLSVVVTGEGFFCEEIRGMFRLLLLILVVSLSERSAHNSRFEGSAEVSST